jgi:hypothetical protein
LDQLFRDVLTRYPVARCDEELGLEGSFWPLIAEDAGFTEDESDLVSGGQHPRAYAVGSIVSKTFATGAIPSSDLLAADLAALLTAYQPVIPSSRLRMGEVVRHVPMAWCRV